MYNEPKEGGAARSELELFSSIIGIPISSVALISLIQRVFSIGLLPIFSDFIDFWRRLTYPLSNILNHLIPFNLPSWYQDGFVFSFIILVILQRAYAVVDHVTRASAATAATAAAEAANAAAKAANAAAEAAAKAAATAAVEAANAAAKAARNAADEATNVAEKAGIKEGAIIWTVFAYIISFVGSLLMLGFFFLPYGMFMANDEKFRTVFRKQLLAIVTITVTFYALNSAIR